MLPAWDRCVPRPPTLADSDPIEFAAGCLVVAVGLVNAPELNGCLGESLARDTMFTAAECVGRVPVRFTLRDGTERSVRIKPGNLSMAIPDGSFPDGVVHYPFEMGTYVEGLRAKASLNAGVPIDRAVFPVGVPAAHEQQSANDMLVELIKAAAHFNGWLMRDQEVLGSRWAKWLGMLSVESWWRFQVRIPQVWHCE